MLLLFIFIGALAIGIVSEMATLVIPPNYRIGIPLCVIALVLIFRKLSDQTTVPGWTSLIVVVLLASGVTIITIGVAALYIGSVFDQVKGRPRFIVDALVAGKESQEGLSLDDTVSPAFTGAGAH